MRVGTRVFAAVAAIVFFGAVVPVEGRAEGWLEGTVRSVGSGVGRRAVDEVADGAYESGKDVVLEAVRSKEGGPDSGTIGSGGVGKPEQGSPGRREAPLRSPVVFLPGDRTIFVDDFPVYPPGGATGKWSSAGPRQGIGPGNAVEVVTWEGRRYLRSRPAPRDGRQGETMRYARLRPGTVLTGRFTVEFDAVLGHSSGGRFADRYVLLLHRNLGSYPTQDYSDSGEIGIAGDEVRTANVAASVDRCDGGLHRVAVAVDGSSVRVFLDGEMILEDPEGVSRPVHHVGIVLQPGNGEPTERLMMTGFRLAEGGGPPCPVTRDRCRDGTGGEAGGRRSPPDGRRGG